MHAAEAAIKYAKAGHEKNEAEFQKEAKEIDDTIKDKKKK